MHDHAAAGVLIHFEVVEAKFYYDRIFLIWKIKQNCILQLSISYV